MWLLLPESMVESPKAKTAVIFGVAVVGIVARETKKEIKKIVKKMAFLESIVFFFLVNRKKKNRLIFRRTKENL